MYLADLHIHSRFSRATSPDCDAPHLDLLARQKGVGLVGTGDFTHPGWRAALRESLVPAEEGLYTLRDELRLPSETAGEGRAARFVLSGEISTIYKKAGRTRKVHSVILLPDLEAAERLALRLEAVGNVHSDGRPILGLDTRDLLEITLDACPEAIFIPAHIWTPHFSLFGAFSGFDTIEECFDDLTGEIHALETGLSSDPAMNWCVSALDRFTLVSNSDAHSPKKLAREANLIDAELSFPSLKRAIERGEGFEGTLEFFPEEGKYHLDGHRSCGAYLTPAETERLGGRCPVCGRRVTVGVQHRICELADRPEGFVPSNAKPFERLVPLPELIGSALGSSAESLGTRRLYERMLRELGPELTILRETAPDDVARVGGPCVAEALRRLRAGRVERIAGYDGVYGRILLLDASERDALMGRVALFGAAEGRKAAEKKAEKRRPAQKPTDERPSEPASDIAPETLNERQQAAAETDAPVVAVVAGPGTGKTKTLVARIAHLIESGRAKPSEITAVTFTNQAAGEMRTRLEARLGGKRAVRGMTIGTFHALCLRLLDARPLLDESEARLLVRDILRERGSAESPGEVLRRISRAKCGADCGEADVDPAVYEAYCARCRALGVRDLDDLLLDALQCEDFDRRGFSHLLVDEFQDINAVQRQLVRHWSREGRSLFVIGDPDQSIYGFRGASAACFAELAADLPALTVISLTQNYRSAPEILSAALAVIDHNPGTPRTLNAAAAAGEPAEPAVRLIRADSPFSEGVWIAKEIARLAGGVDMLEARSDGWTQARPFSDMAVLCRTHRQLEAIEACLRHDGIPCVVAGRGGAFEDDAVQAALAFFRFVQNPADRAALETCRRLAFEEDGSQPDPALSENGADAGCGARLLAARDEFAPLIGKEKPRLLLERWAAAHGPAPALTQLMDMAVFYRSMAELLGAVTLGEEADLLRASGKSYASGAVRLMTLHGAKGLEFPVVFLAGLTAGELPLERAGQTDMDEERRLFFVGMTRAREQLILTSAAPHSAFLDELLEAVTAHAERARRFSSDARQLKLF